MVRRFLYCLLFVWTSLSGAGEDLSSVTLIFPPISVASSGTTFWTDTNAAWYRVTFDSQTVQNIFQDDTGHGFPATNFGGGIQIQQISTVPQTKNAGFCDGIDDYTTILSNAAWTAGSGPYSYGIWFCPSGVISRCGLMGKYSTAGADFSDPMGVYTASNAWWLGWQAATMWSAFSTNQAIQSGKWHYVVTTFATNDVSLYLNGVLIATDTTASKTAYNYTTCYGHGRAWFDSDFRYFRGWLSDPEVFNYAISSNQVWERWQYMNPTNYLKVRI